MSKSVTFLAHAKEGVLHIHHRKNLDAAIREWKGDVIGTLELGTKRTVAFNAYYFGAMKYLSEQTGYTQNELHEMNKEDFNAHPVQFVNKKTGEITERMVPQSTAKMSTSAFMEFLERVRQGWAERGYEVPDIYWKEAA